MRVYYRVIKVYNDKTEKVNKHAKQYGGFAIENDTKSFIIKIFICSMIMTAFIYVTKGQFNELFYSESFSIKALSLFGTIAASVLVFIFCAYLFKIHKVLLLKT